MREVDLVGICSFWGSQSTVYAAMPVELHKLELRHFQQPYVLLCPTRMQV